jgi:hypothetical protein
MDVAKSKMKLEYLGRLTRHSREASFDDVAFRLQFKEVGGLSVQEFSCNKMVDVPQLSLEPVRKSVIRAVSSNTGERPSSAMPALRCRRFLNNLMEFLVRKFGTMSTIPGFRG